MRAFILGGTGSIGAPIVNELIARGHEVTALSRSEISDKKLSAAGATPLRGDLLNPALWITEAVAHDAIIQVAATFDDDMGEVDARVVNAIIEAAARTDHRPRLLYTGGCWLYGATGDTVATEDHPFNPIPAFDWMVVNSGERLLNCPDLCTTILHPAMVYDPNGGVFDHMLNAALEDRPLEIWGDTDVRWPIVEAFDLARAYCDLLVRPDLTGHFNVSAEDGVCIKNIVNSFKAAYDNAHAPFNRHVDDLIKEHGSWAVGPTLDQQMSSAKLRAATGWSPEVTDYRISGVFRHKR